MTKTREPLEVTKEATAPELDKMRRQLVITVAILVAVGIIVVAIKFIDL